MLTIILIVLIILMLGGWGYGARSGGYYGGAPFGILGLILIIVLIWLLLGGRF